MTDSRFQAASKPTAEPGSPSPPRLSPAPTSPQLAAMAACAVAAYVPVAAPRASLKQASKKAVAPRVANIQKAAAFQVRHRLRGASARRQAPAGAMARA